MVYSAILQFCVPACRYFILVYTLHISLCTLSLNAVHNSIIIVRQGKQTRRISHVLSDLIKIALLLGGIVKMDNVSVNEIKDISPADFMISN